MTKHKFDSTFQKVSIIKRRNAFHTFLFNSSKTHTDNQITRALYNLTQNTFLSIKKFYNWDKLSFQVKKSYIIINSVYRFKLEST